MVPAAVTDAEIAPETQFWLSTDVSNLNTTAEVPAPVSFAFTITVATLALVTDAT